MSAIVRKALERARDRLLESERAGIKLGSQLIESIIPRRSHWNGFPPGKFYGKEYTAAQSTSYRDFHFLVGTDNCQLVTDTPTLDVHGKPIIDNNGRALACVLGAHRKHFSYGAPDASDLYSQIASEAGRCLFGLPDHLQRLLPIPTLQTPTDELRWTFAVYDLAWNQFAGSPLQEPIKYAWFDHTNFSLDLFPLQRQNPPIPPGLENITDPPEHWYAEIDDLFSAARQAIDVLLAVWDTVPPGWVGVHAPEKIEGLQAYLQHVHNGLKNRAGRFPQFRDATNETLFDGIAAKQWWPYQQYASEQVNDAWLASDNAVCWLNHHGITNCPPVVEQRDKPAQAEQKLNTLFQFVAKLAAPVDGVKAASKPAELSAATTVDSLTPIKPPRQKRGKKRGRPRLSKDDAKKREALIADWKRAKEAEQTQKEFCKDRKITPDHLQRCIEWAATRKRRANS